jgi:Thiopurine S-methyltransferase (TPMT)
MTTIQVQINAEVRVSAPRKSKSSPHALRHHWDGANRTFGQPDEFGRLGAEFISQLDEGSFATHIIPHQHWFDASVPSGNSSRQGERECKNAMNDNSRPEFWDERYAGQRMPWDFGGVPSVLRDCLSREKPGKVLIPGCGTGYEVRAFARSSWQVDAVDFSLEAIRHARKFLGEDARFVRQADFFAESPNGPFDLVYERIFLCSLPKTCGRPTPRRSRDPSARAGARWIFLLWLGTGTSTVSASTRRTSRPFRRAFHANRKHLGIGFPAVLRRQGELADREKDMKTFAVNGHRGILSALGSALLFGASTPLAKLAVSSADHCS